MTLTYDQQYIGGTWRSSLATAFVDVQDPNTGKPLARVTCGHTQDAALAVKAAHDAFPAWFDTALEQRTALLRKFGAALARRKDSLTQAMASEIGTPLKIAHIVQVDAPIRNIDNFIQSSALLAWEQQIGNSLIVREPFGVVACITPWNFPLHQIVLKVVPALLAGNTVVLKPSELTPLTTQLISEALDESDFPAGVVNVVNGLGAEVGAFLAAAEHVDMVSFTGSTEAGRAVSALAAATVKKVTTELGGKSPALVLSSGDLARAVKATVASCMLNNGQTCSAHTRLLVPEEQQAQVDELLKLEMAKLTLGGSLAEGTRVGPLISSQQQTRVKTLVAEGVVQGAKSIHAPAPAPADGFFVSPQAFWVAPGNVLARTEVFGPVLSVITYRDVDEAVRIANDTVFGLAAAVWGDPQEALHVARRIRAGQVDINGARFNALAPFGGFKQSGVGREGGSVGLDEFLEYKAIQQNAPQQG